MYALKSKLHTNTISHFDFCGTSVSEIHSLFFDFIFNISD